VLTYHRGARTFRRPDLGLNFPALPLFSSPRRWKLARAVFSCFSLPGKLHVPILCFIHRARNRCALLDPASSIRFDFCRLPRNSPEAAFPARSPRVRLLLVIFLSTQSSFRSVSIFTSFPISSAAREPSRPAGLLCPDFVFLFS
jgi:hypothetical protein